jgi:uncharacterized protein YkwD
MSRRGPFVATIAMLVGVLVLHVGVGLANRKSKSSRGACAGARTTPVDENTRREATIAVLCLINNLRARYHQRPVRASLGLTVSALQHSADMVQRGYFSHDGPGGDTPLVRAQRNGYIRAHHSFSLSEAIAWDEQATPLSLVRQLRLSPEHRAILLDPDQRDVGIGLTLGAPVAGVTTSSSTLVLAFGY